MIVVEAASLAVGDVILPFGRRTRPAGVVLVEPAGPRVRLVLRSWRSDSPYDGPGSFDGAVVWTRTERISVRSRTRFKIATRLPTPVPGMELYRRGVGRRLVAWYPVFK